MVLSDKVGIITFHNAINYGAVLQAYAQQRFLNMNGLDAEVIDYQCNAFKDNYKAFKLYDRTITGIIKALLKMPSIYKKNRKFHLFLKKYIKMSNKVYTLNDVAATNKLYKLFVAGSDQVWNLTLTGGDRNYFLKFVDDDRKKVSYAASMGSVNLNSGVKDILKEDLGRYLSISVREEDAREFLEKLLRKQVDVVLDPVFLLDKAEWDKIAILKQERNYILVYCLHEHAVYEQAKMLSDATGLKVVCIQNSMKKPIKAEYVLDVGPQEFVGYIKNAKYIVTDSFHGAAFGVIYRKQIRVVLKKELTGLNGRLITLMDAFGLMDVVVNDDADVKKLTADIKYNEDVIEEKIFNSRRYLLDLVGETVNEKRDNI